jgi:hypothetical protein
MLWSWIVCKRGEHACAVAGRLSTVTLRASYFGSSWASSQAPPRLVTTVKLRRERSAAWLSGVLPLPIHDPGHVPIMARGRLVAQCHDTTEFERNRSVARPQPCPWAQASWMCYEIGPCTAYGGSPGKPHVDTLRKRACSVYSSRRSPKPIPPRVRSSFGVGSGTARRYLQSLSTYTIRAQHILSTIVANALIWNGSYSLSGLLHTTFIRLPLRLFLNSTFRPPPAYQLFVGTTPTCPRRNH